LNGGAGADTLIGGDGNDTITGGPGQDVLIGQGGTDRFVFGVGDAAFLSQGSVSDVISDFTEGTDKLLLPSGIGSGTGQVLYPQAGIVLTSVVAATAYAQQLLDAHSGTRDVAAITVGSDSYLFYNDAGGATINSIIKLAGIADAGLIGSADFLPHS
jgi:Ca2+-binding RTX toxin-like protein